MSSLSFWQVTTPLRAALFVDLSSALVAHQWFRRHEPQNITSGLIQLFIFAIAPVLTAVMTLQSPLLDGPLHCILFASFVLGSILFYRVGPFHPLAKYPGPIICKTTKIWGAYLSHKGKLHWYLHDLHKRYGSVVRIGPNELSVVDVDLLPSILGQQGMPKGPLWDGRAFLPAKMRNTQMSLISVRDYNVHAQLRKPWNRSFGPNPLEDYEESLIATGNELVDLLRDCCRKSDDKFGHADLAEYIGKWSFDFMGNMAFGESFGLMRNGDKDGLITQMKAAAETPAITQMIPWALDFVRALPYSRKRMGNFVKFAVGQAQKRIAKVTEKRDLFYHLAASMNIDDDKPPTPYLVSNVVLAIVAGSDTTSAVLAGIMYNLIQYPDYFKRLRKELDEAFPPSERAAIKPNKLGNLELLNAIVNETLRLQPPVLTMLQRAPAKNSGGKIIGDMFIREGTAITVPPYVMHRDPRYFYPKTDEFWPERWLTQNSDKVTLNRPAFIPFSYGPANCAGKTLAISELRYITAMLVCNFEFEFEDGYNPSVWRDDIMDQFVLVVGKLPVKFRQRSL